MKEPRRTKLRNATRAGISADPPRARVNVARHTTVRSLLARMNAVRLDYSAADRSGIGAATNAIWSPWGDQMGCTYIFWPRCTSGSFQSGALGERATLSAARPRSDLW